MRRIVVFVAALALGTVAVGCAPQIAANTVVPVDTAVALTLQAISAAATPLPSATAIAQPTSVPDVLPHDLYFLNRDANGVLQIFRLGRDGKTLQQITFEPLDVGAFDVSPVDGRVAYITNNQLYLVDAAGAGRQLLIDGGPVDDNNRWTNSVGAPVWSPDGGTLAYSHGGLSFLDFTSGATSLVLENQVDTTPGFPVVKELYSPRAYSPDGSKLLIDIGFYEGGTYGIYLRANSALVRFQRAEGGIVCCHTNWIPDGSGVYVSSPVMGMVESGLYHADAATGNVITLLPGSLPDGTYNFAYAGQVGPDNKLYFFFNNLPQIPTEGHTPLYLVRSDPDGSTNRTQLQPDVFNNINEILWAQDASLAVVVASSDPNESAGGEARAVYVDGRASVVLAPAARALRWGP
jgi:Tol biopolymer transport system component